MVSDLNCKKRWNPDLDTSKYFSNFLWAFYIFLAYKENSYLVRYTFLSKCSTGMVKISEVTVLLLIAKLQAVIRFHINNFQRNKNKWLLSIILRKTDSSYLVYNDKKNWLFLFLPRRSSKFLCSCRAKFVHWISIVLFSCSSAFPLRS